MIPHSHEVSRFLRVILPTAAVLAASSALSAPLSLRPRSTLHQPLRLPVLTHRRPVRPCHPSNLVPTLPAFQRSVNLLSLMSLPTLATSPSWQEQQSMSPGATPPAEPNDMTSS